MHRGNGNGNGIDGNDFFYGVFQIYSRNIMGIPIKDTISGKHSVYRTATYCNTLQHTATHCNTLQHTATHCNTLSVYPPILSIFYELCGRAEKLAVQGGEDA